MNHQGVCLFIEWTGENVHPVALELLNEGRRLADLLQTELSAIFLGPPEAQERLEELAFYGADRLIVSLSPAFSSFQDDLQAQVVAQILEEKKPEVMLFAATSRGQALAPRVAGLLRLGLTAHCLAFEIRPEDRALVQVRPSFGENVMAKIISRTKPQMATVRPGVFSPAKPTGRKAEIETWPLPEKLESALEVLEKRQQPQKKVDLSQAEIVVAGGRGLRTKELFQQLCELARLLGAAVGATRPVCHLGWISEEHMIGVSGQTVSPKLYLGFGLSGALHHLVGIKDADFLVAVNLDPEAPVMKKADLALVGDVREVIPLLLRRLKELKGTEEGS